MKVTVDLGSPTPQYEQIRSQIVALITTGALGQGDRLPTVRVLASDLGIAPGTVARAYRELEAAGQVVTRRRVGTTISARSRSAGQTLPLAHRLAAAAWTEGISDSDLIDLVRSALLERRTGGSLQHPATRSEGA